MDSKLVLDRHSIDTTLTLHWQLGWHSIYITVDSWSIRSQQILINANESVDPWLAIDGLFIMCRLSMHGRLIKGIHKDYEMIQFELLSLRRCEFAEIPVRQITT